MKLFLIIVASLALLMALILYLRPTTLVKTSAVLNREVEADDYVFSRRIVFGSLLIALGVIMLYFLIWG